MKKWLTVFLLALAAGSVSAADNSDSAIKPADTNATSTKANAAEAVPAQPKLMSGAKLRLGGKEITLLVAETDDQRAQGLKGVSKLGENEGMIFSYGSPVEKACMWMKDTKIPVDVAFIDGTGKIINIEANMKPLSKDNHCNTGGPVWYAIEMNAGWFAKNGVKPGDSLAN